MEISEARMRAARGGGATPRRAHRDEEPATFLFTAACDVVDELAIYWPFRMIDAVDP